MSTTYRSSMAVAVALMLSCAQLETPRTTAAKPKRPVVTSTTEKAAQVSPAVAALLKPDPDLDRKMTPEEIKAALAAAQRSAPPPPATAPQPARGSGEWQKLEADQKAKSDEYERRLASTVVYVGPDGRYHTAGCPTLMETLFDRMGQVIQTRFVGRQTTLASARDQHLSPHAECGAPSYQWSYSQ